MLIFVVDDDKVDAVVKAIAAAAVSGNESGDGLVWSTVVENVTHNRTGLRLEEVEAA
jgi:nitrogen regulatory protein PII